MADDLTQQEIQELTDRLFLDAPELAKFRLDTPDGPVLHFKLESPVGWLLCRYPLPEAVKAVYRTSQDHKEVARLLLAEIGRNLPLSLLIALENSLDAAKVAAQEKRAAVVSTRKEKPERYKAKRLAGQHTAALKKMDERNRSLVEPPRQGEKPAVTLRRISAAIRQLQIEGRSLDDITGQALALRLRCTVGAISHAFARARPKTTLKDFKKLHEIDK